jgi:sugar phosphate isomerase/epimerase/ubiquinone/menaquinone biosynthesis C-methylase UbiE
MLSAAVVFLGALLASPQGQADPELSPDGRVAYLGREVAHTMHWTGAPWLLRATREDEENGALLQSWLAVKPGQAVCDLGCGNGYHTLPLMKAVGSEGKVFAVDLQPEMLKLLAMRAAQLHFANVALIEALVDDPKLPAGSCDLVLLVDVYHELSHPVTVMGHVRRALKPNGRVVLVEFRAEDPAVPIKPEHTMTKAQVVREMAELGFALADQFDELPWQHAMSFAPAVDAGERLAALQFVRGFVSAWSNGDPRIVQPYLAPSLRPQQLPVLPKDVRIELRAEAGGRVCAALQKPDGARIALGSDEVVILRDGVGRWFVEAIRAHAPQLYPSGNKWPLFAMHTGTGGGSIDAQAALVSELGFEGIAWDIDRLPEVRRACESRGAELISAYAVLEPGKDQAERCVPLRAAMRSLAGGQGMLWLALQQSGVALRDPAGDEAAVLALTPLLAEADATGVEIALYPHHGCWLETAEDALRLCERIGNPRLGLCFNLCHFLRTGTEPNPAVLLQRCRSHLFAVTLNGADLAGDDWHALIRPLGEGDFDLRGFFATLEAVGFEGPVGLQGFGIERPAREHLTASIKAWRAAAAR